MEFPSGIFDSLRGSCKLDSLRGSSIRFADLASSIPFGVFDSLRGSRKLDSLHQFPWGISLPSASPAQLIRVCIQRRCSCHYRVPVFLLIEGGASALSAPHF